MNNVAKALEVMGRVGQRPDFEFTEAESVLNDGKTRLLRYRRAENLLDAPPVLLIPSLINRYYILDLLPRRSYVEFLVNQGFRVYLLDWGEPDDADRNVTLEDHVQRFINRATEEICRTEQAEKVSLVGYCMGGTLSLMYAALEPEKVANLVLLATPVDFANDSLLSVWAREPFFDADRLVDTYGNVPVSVMQSVFQLLKPAKTYTRYIDLYQNADNPEFVETFLAFDYWANDQIPIAGETFRKFVKETFQQNLLIKDQMTLGGIKISLRKIKSRLLSVLAEHDNIVPPPSAAAIEGKSSASEFELVRVPGGHHGLTIGSSAQKIVWKRTAEWLAK